MITSGNYSSQKIHLLAQENNEILLNKYSNPFNTTTTINILLPQQYSSAKLSLQIDGNV